ncbi:uncharacterized protein RAG0_15117 [Rhynchosporium agropyri]|uniref:Uncharacterized protein n=3 Tax=Rhynchosporium TaxID=38037 RepID=A0A1E1M4J3_RHYSE|nr:uncharacterized protein RCO7_14866 [Rhynchosporium commune]CZT10721.1 uncharacterized protein RAG0_15117 [Rhynchosporium agropyri]CZT44017.1 uncharacterized protein RSE6_04137 [Rhynchosporium secalis]
MELCFQPDYDGVSVAEAEADLSIDAWIYEKETAVRDEDTNL